MIRSLLNKLNTPKALRQALVLFTLLLLPSAAWGDVTYTSTFQIDGSGSSTQCSAKESTGNFRYNWTSNIDVAQGDYLTIVADQSYSLVSAYRIFGTVKSVVVRGSGLASLKIYYSQNIDGSSSTLMGEPSFNDNTYTFTPESQIGDLNSNYLCLSFKGDTSGGKIESIEVTFTPKLRVGNYVFEATETSFDDGKIIFQKDNSDNYYLLLKEASIEGNIEWHVGHDLNLKFSGTNRITNIASEASSNYAIKGSGSNALNIIQNTDASTTTPDALILASYYTSSNTPVNATNLTDLITRFSNIAASPLVNFENYDKNNIKYKCYTTSDNVFGLTVGGRKVHKIPDFVGYKNDIFNDGTVKFTPSTNYDGSDENMSTWPKLTLNGANISYSDGNVIVCTLTESLIVELVGKNTINCGSNIAFEGPYAGTDLALTTSSTSPGSLTMTSTVTDFGTSNYAINFRAVSQGNLMEATSSNGVTTELVYSKYLGVSIAGVDVSSANYNADGTITGLTGIKYVPAGETTPGILSLDNVNFTSGITWNTDADLTVEIIGSNNTITSSSGSCFDSTHSDKTISFTRGDTNNASKLVLNASTNHVISGFSNYEKPTVTDMFWIPTITSYIISATITSSLLGGGAGTESSPLVISTFDHLKDFATYVNIGTLTTEYVQLADNLDCSGKTGFEPIGTGSYPFKGTFDGNNKTISGLEFVTNDGPDFAGLFGKLDHESGLIKDLTLSGCTFKGGDCAGAIVAYLSKGTIQDCEVNSCIIETGNPQSPSCGGIVGTIQKGVVSNCTVNGGTITASTTYSSSPGNSFAGGIVGRYYLYAGNKISGCEVKGNVTITSSHAEATSSLSAGAIIGGTAYGDGPSLEDLDFSSNYYYSTVTTSTKKANDAAVEKSGQTQRGIGDGDDVIGQVELAGTKTVTVKFISSNGNDSWDAVEGTYYKTSTIGTAQKDYYVLPGCNFTFSMKPKNGYKPRFALSDDAIEVTDVEKTENEAYDHTEFTFTMPSDDLEVIWSYPIDLAADNITATIDNANYTGEAIVPTTVKVIGAPGSVGSTPRQLTKDTDFTIKGYKLNGESVDSPVDIGTYTVTIEGTGNYIGTQDVSYEIVKAYALRINGTQLNAKNIDDFYGNGTVKFTPATETEPTNTLTLNFASVTGTIESGLGNLTIKLIGSNTIQGNGSSLITSLNGGTLTFDSDGTTISSLEFKNASGYVFPNDPISEFAEVKYGWFEYVESEGSKKVCSWDIEIIKNETSYRIYDGNKDHILGEGDESVKYSHDATNGHVITLNNAEVNCIWTDIHADITIALNGTNRVIDTGRTYAIYSNNGKINFVKAEEATKAELTATCRNGYVPIEYGSITLGEGLYWKPFYADANATVKSTVITDDPEFIIIEDYVMTDDRSIETAITYDSTEKILTFNSYAGALTSQIKTGVQGLTIKLKGTSTVAAGSLDYPFKAMTNTASILFDGENDSETGSLVIETNSDSAPFEGFAEGAITYNKVVYSRDDGGNNIHTIKAPTAPAMSLDNEKVKLTKDYDDGTIYYSIAYADDTPSETGVKYTEPFAITHPGVVTAWVEANNATTGTVTGKHFAYQDAPYTMAINGIKTPTLLPTIAEGDVISLQRYASEDEDIASFIDGLITAKKPGTVTLSAILMPGDNTPFKVLNPVSDPNAPNEHTVSFSVYVGENLSNYFEGSNEFGTFYNEDSEIYAVPQGMKAYVVTSVSGSKLVTVETTVLPPNTVVLLDKAEGISFTKVPAEGAAPGGNLLKHATAEVSVTTESSLYVLYNDTYVKATAGSPIPTGKNYLDLSPTTNAGTRGFYNIIGEDDGSTGIREVKSGEVNSEKWNGEWFDLQGRRLPAKPTKSGLYLHNGIKVVIK